MHNPYFLQQGTLYRYDVGPLRLHLAGYAIFLKDEGYVYSSGQRYLREIAHLSAWMDKGKIAINRLNENLVWQYIPFRKKSPCKPQVSTYWLFLKYLRKEKIIKAPIPEKCSPAQKIVRDFETYLVKDRGLAKETIRHYLRFAKEFLLKNSEKSGLRLRHIKVENLTDYIIRHRQACARSYAIRQLFRFLFLRGSIVRDISTGIPNIPHWRQCQLPSFLEPDEIGKWLTAFNSKTPTDLRDLSVKLLLVRLGLRAIEICRLKLEDIDWKNGQISIKGKSGSQQLLPLPYETGKALADYLRHGRPKCTDRHVFIRSVAPYKGFSNTTAIGHIVRKSLKKAGIKKMRSGSHLLRHTCATQMLRRGATLSEIGEILRHQSVDTTMIYAKVALDDLAPLASPWPGEAE
jgi:site-specific recombinase XerD